MMARTILGALTFAFVLVLLALAFMAAVAVLAGQQANTIYVRPKEAFVYPDGEAFIMVVASGSYRIIDTQAAGCYRLATPQPGKIVGKADRIWPFCLKGARYGNQTAERR